MKTLTESIMNSLAEGVLDKDFDITDSDINPLVNSIEIIKSVRGAVYGEEYEIDPIRMSAFAELYKDKSTLRSHGFKPVKLDDMLAVLKLRSNIPEYENTISPAQRKFAEKNLKKVFIIWSYNNGEPASDINEAPASVHIYIDNDEWWILGKPDNIWLTAGSHLARNAGKMYCRLGPGNYTSFEDYSCYLHNHECYIVPDNVFSKFLKKVGFTLHPNSKKK